MNDEALLRAYNDALGACGFDVKLELHEIQSLQLCKENQMAITLYTGPMYELYNVILRAMGREEGHAVCPYGIFKDQVVVAALAGGSVKVARFVLTYVATHRGLYGPVNVVTIIHC